MNITKKLPFLSFIFVSFCTTAMENKKLLTQDLQQKIGLLSSDIVHKKNGKHFAQHFLVYKNGPHGDLYLGYGSLDNYIDFAYKSNNRICPWVCYRFRFFIPKNNVDAKKLNLILAQHVTNIIHELDTKKAT